MFKRAEPIKENVSNWIVSNWNGEFFDDPNTANSAVVSNWFAVSSLRLLNKSSDLVFPELFGYKDDITDWLDNECAHDDGGFSTGLNSTITETGAAIALLKVLDKLNSSTTDWNLPIRIY